VKLLIPTAALLEDCQEISQNLTPKNSRNSTKKAMSPAALFREPKHSTIFLRLLNATAALSDDCQEISQNSTQKNSRNSPTKAMGFIGAFLGAPNIPQIL
jgi:hypothetical protein